MIRGFFVSGAALFLHFRLGVKRKVEEIPDSGSSTTAEVESALRSIAGVSQAFVANVAYDGTQEVAALIVSTADHEIVADARFESARQLLPVRKAVQFPLSTPSSHELGQRCADDGAEAYAASCAVARS